MMLWRPLFGVLAVVLAVYFAAVSNGGFYQPASCTLLGLSCPRWPVEGTSTAGYEPIKKFFEDLHINGEDIASQLTVYVKGKEALNIWTGERDLKGSKMEKDSLALVYSGGKVVESLVAAMLVDRQLIRYSDKISKYWPEFAQKGKEDIIIKQLLQHEAGLAGFWDAPVPYSYELLRDQDKMKKMIEESSVRYLGEPLYHGSTRGWILSQIVRKVDSKHRSLGQFIREEINAPLKDVEVYVGLPEEKENKMTEMMPDPPLGQQLIILAKFLLGRLPSNIQQLTSQILNSESFINRYAINTIPGGVLNVVNSQEFHSIEMSSSNTISNAHSLGKIAGLLANLGEIDGVKLLSRNAVEAAIVRDQKRSMDRMLFTNDSWTVGGFGDLSDGFLPMGEGWIGWGGFGGTLIAFHVEKQVGVAYVIKGMMPAYPIDQRHKRIIKVVEECISKS